jgi:hypothetical protein
MTQFVPSDGKKLQRVDQVSNYGNIPEAENNDRHCDDLQT